LIHCIAPYLSKISRNPMQILIDFLLWSNFKELKKFLHRKNQNQIKICNEIFSIRSRFTVQLP
jgi:hypothetical protein